MKILFAGASPDVYGSDAVLRSVAEHFQGRQTDCVLVLPADGLGRAVAEKAGLRVEIARTTVLRRADLTPFGLTRLLATLAPRFLSHVQLLRRERPDLVWVNTITLPLWILAARFFRRVVVCHSHEIVGGPRWLRALMYSPLFFAHRVLVVSNACQSEIVATHPRLAEKITVALNPSFSVEGTLPVRHGWDDHIVLIGRISARKGIAVLVEALRDPRFARLQPVVHICGDAHPAPAAQRFASRVQAQAAEAYADIRFHGYVPATEALSMGGVVVVPSVDPDPCPLVVAEAIAAGRAVVASDCGGIAEVAGGAARLVEAGRPDLLADSLLRVLSRPRERAELERRSAARAAALSATEYFRRLDEIFDELPVRGWLPPQEVLVPEI